MHICELGNLNALNVYTTSDTILNTVNIKVECHNLALNSAGMGICVVVQNVDTVYWDEVLPCGLEQCGMVHCGLVHCELAAISASMVQSYAPTCDSSLLCDDVLDA